MDRKLTFLRTFLAAALCCYGTLAAQRAAAQAIGYPVWVKGTQVTNSNQGDVLGDGKVKYDPDAKTLTLADGPTVSGAAGDTLILAKGQDLKIDAPDGLTLGNASESAGIYLDEGHLEVSVGEGKALTVKVADAAIYANQDIKLTGDVDVEAAGTGGNGIVSAASLTIKGQVKAISAAGSAISAKTDIMLTGPVKAEGGDYGILSYDGTVTIDGQVDATGTDKAAIYAAGAINLAGDSVSAKGGEFGIASTGDITIGCKTKAVGTNRGGIVASGTLTVRDTVVADGAALSIFAQTVSIAPPYEVVVPAKGKFIDNTYAGFPGQTLAEADGATIALHAEIYAVNYTVTFDANGHGTAPAAQTVGSGLTVAKPATDPSATGWTFGGWYKDAAGTEAWNFATDVVRSDTTLYAGWRELYGITLSATGGGRAEVSAKEAHEGSEITVTATPAVGYELYSIFYVPSGGHVVNITSTGKFTMPAAAVTVSVSFMKTPSSEVRYTVTLPEIEGASLTPGPGTYQVVSGYNFKFRLTPQVGYAFEGRPTITMGIPDYDQRVEYTPVTSGGRVVAYDIRITDIRRPFGISLVGGLNPVGNETLGGTRVWADAGTLYIIVNDRSAHVRVFNLAGTLAADRILQTGQSSITGLPRGVYLVEIGNETYKVVF